jgi:very-short-patch-repair endonuclease
VQSQPLPNTPTTKPTPASANKKPPLDSELLVFACKLRQEHSDPERFMWALLRDRRFCGFKFRRQHPVKPYVLDFYCPAARLAIELDGGQHNTDAARRYDESRTKFIATEGIEVLRFWNHDVLKDIDAVLEAIHIALTRSNTRDLSPGER